MAPEAPPVRSDELYAQLFDTAPDAMVVVADDGRIKLVNVQTEKLFGYARAELIGQPLDVLIPARFRHRHVGHVAHFFGNPCARSMGTGVELFGTLKDGTEIPIEVSLSPLRTADGITVSAAIRDISARRQMEAAAKLLADQLREARLVADVASNAKSEFLASMSHELRTPLNAILGFAQLLQRDKKQPLSERHKERVDHILRGGEHLLRLIDDILDLSRIEAGGISISSEPVGVLEVFEEVRTTLEPMATRQGIRIEVEAMPNDLPMVVADRTRFVQILMNLGSNAIKYNRPAGSVSISASRPTPSHVRITVRDTGIGIPEEKQDKLFQPFQRAGQETGPIEGTGIGLVITKRLAGLMQGEVGFRSVAGEGSEFWVDIPVHESDGRASIPTKRDSDPKRRTGRGRRSILYVEDNPANVAFMKDLLGTFDDIDLLAAPTAELGVALARDCHPAVIIMDINLPGMSGFDALRVLLATAETKEIPVIALTAAASERDRERGKQAGFSQYLTKPVKVSELVAALESLLV